MKQLVLNSLKMRKVQSASIAITVALSAMVLMTFGLVYGGVMQGVATAEERGGADVMAVPSDALSYVSDAELLYTGAPAPVYMNEDVADKIAEAEGAAKVSSQFFSQTLNSACCSTTGETRLIGIDPATDFVVKPLAGDDAVAALDDSTVIIGSEVGGVFDGWLTIRDKRYEVAAVMAETGTEFDSSIVSSMDVAREQSRQIEGYDRYWKQYGDPDGLVSCVMIELADGADDAAVSELSGDAALSSVTAKINLTGEATPLVRSEVAERAQGQLGSVFLLLAVAAVIMAVVALLQLFSRFFSIVWDRKAEFALYRAIGASKGDLRKMIALEMAVLVAPAAIAGIALGFVAQSALLATMQGSSAFPYVALGVGPVAALAVVVVVLFAAVSHVSIAWPLSQIGKLDPSAAMQQGGID